MKNLIVSLILITSFLTKASAQDDPDQMFHFGLKASPSVAWVRVEADGVTNESIRIGFTYGLITEFRITKNYAFATGVDISYRSGKIKANVDVVGNSIDIVQKFQFVELPLALKLKTNEIGYMKYYGMFGISPSVLVKASQDIESNLAAVPNRKNRGNQSDFTIFNLSLNVGLGIEYNLGGSTSFTTGLHYTNGLIDIWTIKDSQMRSDAITLNIGVLF
jgi:hypothetical protein